METVRKPVSLISLAVTLLLSGTAALVNQVAWQRALKPFLGGAEGLSSATVVLVFLAGLGAGGFWVTRRVGRVANPRGLFIKVELALAAFTLLFALFIRFGADQLLSSLTVWLDQLGVPLRAFYVVASVVILGFPTFLMGTTMSLAAEIAQRRKLGSAQQVFPVLIAFNAAGGVFGSLIAGFWAIPYHGLMYALGLAAGANTLAAIFIYQRDATAPLPEIEAQTTNLWRPTKVDLLGAGMGFASLAFEMQLFRIMSLAHTSKPYWFALVLTFFLLFWTLGSLTARKIRDQYPLVCFFIAGAFLAIPSLAYYFRFHFNESPTLTAAVICLPTIFFGLSYAWLAGRDAKSFGRDLARFGAWNTLGACTGVAIHHFVLSRMAPDWALLVLALLVVALGILALQKSKWTQVGQTGLLLAGAVAVFGMLLPSNLNRKNNHIGYFGPDGVVEVTPNANLIWDGLWHSAMSYAESYVGTANWRLAVNPLLAHPKPAPDALVIGLGSGVTAHVLSLAADVKQIDVYDLNARLQSVLTDFPNGTLNVGSNPKIKLLWRDGRTGLLVNQKQYDIITQQPMYLSQAGSSMLLSQEYFHLVKKRLKPSGVLVVYSNAIDTPKQRELIQATVHSVFPNVLSCHDGYMYLASNEPLTISLARSGGKDDFGDQLNRFEAAISEYPGSWGQFGAALDRSCEPSNYVASKYSTFITDQWPVVEYPNVADTTSQDKSP